MFVPFSQLPSTARVWVFQSHRAFTPEEEKEIASRLRAFTEEWVVHGAPLDTSFELPHRHFIVLAADESRQAASGCSIDSSVRVLKEIEQAFDVRLFERDNIGFYIGGNVVLFPLGVLKEKFSDGMLTADTLAFNNLVNTKADFQERWIVRAGDTWLKRYLPKSLEKAS